MITQCLCSINCILANGFHIKCLVLIQTDQLLIDIIGLTFNANDAAIRHSIRHIFQNHYSLRMGQLCNLVRCSSIIGNIHQVSHCHTIQDHRSLFGTQAHFFFANGIIDQNSLIIRINCRYHTRHRLLLHHDHTALIHRLLFFTSVKEPYDHRHQNQHYNTTDDSNDQRFFASLIVFIIFFTG